MRKSRNVSFHRHIGPLAAALLTGSTVFCITYGILNTEGTWNLYFSFQHELFGFDAEKLLVPLACGAALIAAASVWFAGITNRPEIRFGIWFWLGVLLQAAAGRCSYHAYFITTRHIENTALDRLGTFETVPILCVFTAFTGIVCVLWAMYVDARDTLEARTPRR